MTPWTGWERRDRHVSFALLLSLPKLDVSYRKAQASKLDRSTPVQIQVSSTWFCSCLYGNDLANVTAFCNVAKSVEVGSEFDLTWSIASQSYNATLETQSWWCSRVLSSQNSCWDLWDAGLHDTQASSRLLKVCCRNEHTKSMLHAPCVLALLCYPSFQDRNGNSFPTLCRKQHKDLWMELLWSDPPRKCSISWELGI